MSLSLLSSIYIFENVMKNCNFIFLFLESSAKHYINHWGEMNKGGASPLSLPIKRKSLSIISE